MALTNAEKQKLWYEKHKAVKAQKVKAYRKKKNEEGDEHYKKVVSERNSRYYQKHKSNQ